MCTYVKCRLYYLAEKLAGYPCVTVSVDDLYLEDQVKLGDVICIQSQVNRAFNTSMEVWHI